MSPIARTRIAEDHNGALVVSVELRYNSGVTSPPRDLTRDRRTRVQLALEGLSIGDAFGQAFFIKRSEPVGELVAGRKLAPAPWRFSDDTVMALALAEVLLERGSVDQDLLASRFAERFAADMNRGYGAVAYWMLFQMSQGMPWREASTQVFGGKGSFGNGAAMRVAPVGAFYAEDLDAVVENARAQAEVTHAHADGQAGAIAVALAAWYACSPPAASSPPSAAGLLAFVTRRTPDGDTRRGLERATKLGKIPVAEAAKELGDGSKVISSDTVPFALWCASLSLDDYEQAIWQTLEGLHDPQSDRDTILAIVGGVVALSAEESSIPAAWRQAREPLGDA